MADDYALRRAKDSYRAAKRLHTAIDSQASQTQTAIEAAADGLRHLEGLRTSLEQQIKTIGEHRRQGQQLQQALEQQYLQSPKPPPIATPNSHPGNLPLPPLPDAQPAPKVSLAEIPDPALAPDPYATQWSELAAETDTLLDAIEASLSATEEQLDEAHEFTEQTTTPPHRSPDRQPARHQSQT